jgi:hypothetical protein
MMRRPANQLPHRLAMRTTLNLLTRSGVVYIDFRPALTGPQYTRLVDIVNRAATEQELRDSVMAFARAERLKVCFDEIEAAAE